MMHEYQKKGLRKFAFRKCLILSNMFLVDQTRQAEKMPSEKEKREQAPAVQIGFFLR
jgi:hypothetical protein